MQLSNGDAAKVAAAPLQCRRYHAAIAETERTNMAFPHASDGPPSAPVALNGHTAAAFPSSQSQNASHSP